MKLKSLTENLSVIKSTADPECEISGIAYDSRAVCPGYTFVAIRGLQTDGHNYIPNAVKAGAAVIICEEVPAEDIPFIQVENSRLALSLISAAWFRYPAREMKLIGVTGTSGKTTTADRCHRHKRENHYDASDQAYSGRSGKCKSRPRGDKREQDRQGTDPYRVHNPREP